uniref:AMP-binding protein n=1 Tax=Nucleocytoviricota sp. TaxID=2809609 RepID=A0A9E8K176_9VIRU|nr:hypothetical protein [Nucleocytoviricota sp.]UZT29215.1 AMP-binding protein [Nucleocytoviricota sp.]
MYNHFFWERYFSSDQNLPQTIVFTNSTNNIELNLKFNSLNNSSIDQFINEVSDYNFYLAIDDGGNPLVINSPSGNKPSRPDKYKNGSYTTTPSSSN